MFVPGQQDFGQPTVFLPGEHLNVFSVMFNCTDDLKWMLKADGDKRHQVEASATSDACRRRRQSRRRRSPTTTTDDLPSDDLPLTTPSYPETSVLPGPSRTPDGEGPGQHRRSRGPDMKITAYPLYGPAATLQPSPEGRGWDFLCPCAFEAVWHGGPDAEDVEIRFAETDVPGQVDFVQSLEGEGRLTFFPGYQCKTEAEHALWVRGPINASKDGAVPLESVIDTSILPGTLTLHWRLTRPGQPSGSKRGSPSAPSCPIPRPAWTK